MNKRIAEWDFIKGFLIIMVMLGHTTASLGDYYKTPLLEYLSSLTVSFIMPFFLISTGYFIYSEKGSIKDVLRKKFRRVVVPAIVWGGFCGLILAAASFAENKSIGSSVIVLARNVKYLWYLFATFASACIITVIRRKVPHKFQNLALIFAAIALHLIPTDLWNIAFSFSFILLGHFLKQKNVGLTWFRTNRLLCVFVCLLYGIMLLFFKYEHSIYIAGTNLLTNNKPLTQMVIDGARFVVGVFGSITIGFLLDMFWKNYEKKHRFCGKVCACVLAVGEKSLNMYCTQYFIIEVVFAGIISYLGVGAFFTENPHVCYFLWRHLFGLILTGITYYVSVILEKSPFGKYIY